MKRAALAALFLTLVGALAAAPAHADTTYTTQSSFNAATTGDTTVTIGGLIADSAASLVYPPAITVGGVDFVIDTSTSNGNLYEVGANYGAGHYGADATLSSQGSTTGINNLVITLPTGETAVSILFNGFENLNSVFTTEPITITLSDGNSWTVTNAAADGSYNFLGITSGTPITSIELTDPDVVGNTTLNVAQIQYGSSAVAATPEPSSLFLLGTGLLGLAVVLSRKFSGGRTLSF
jgi:hypothetical protein